MFHFFEDIKGMGLTTFMLFDNSISLPPPLESWQDLEYLADGVFLLEMTRFRNNVDIQMQIRKMRRTRHDRNFYPLVIENGDFVIKVQSYARGTYSNSKKTKNGM